MRGKLDDIPAKQRERRITPADAGKTRNRSAAVQQPEDHPRGCGENANKKAFYVKYDGSPPRMRGKLPYPTCFFVRVGITPADAGKTPSCTTFAPLVQDHPRGCGENFYKVGLAAYGTGSPPRMRGKRCPIKAIRGERRITPADAGKTLILDAENLDSRDHPRGCGENV